MPKLWKQVTTIKAAREFISEQRAFTKGTLPLVIHCGDEEELKLFRKAMRGMKNVSNLEFKIRRRIK